MTENAEFVFSETNDATIAIVIGLPSRLFNSKHFSYTFVKFIYLPQYILSDLHTFMIAYRERTVELSQPIIMEHNQIIIPPPLSTLSKWELNSIKMQYNTDVVVVAVVVLYIYCGAAEKTTMTTRV